MAMAMFKDELRSNAKHLRMRKHPMAKLLWYDVIVACNEALTDGHVPDYLLDRWAYDCDITTPKQLKACTDILVELKRWHDHETIRDCEDCYEEAGDIDPGSFYVHDYTVHQPRADEVNDPLERRRWRRRKRLHRDTDLIADLRQRDHDRCRYCNSDVDFKSRTADQSGTYDHINPNDFGTNVEGDNDGGNAMHKVVVSCRKCNSIKKNRTPDEAGMTLLPEPTAYDVDTGERLAAPGPVLARSQKTARTPGHAPGPGQDSRAPAREAGRGQDGAGPDRAVAGAGQKRGGSGQAGKAGAESMSGRGRAGPGKAGGGPSRAGTGREAGRPGPAPPATEPTAADRSPTTDARTRP